MLHFQIDHPDLPPTSFVDLPGLSSPLEPQHSETKVKDTGCRLLFVSNLNRNIDEEWLFREFEEFGTITRVKVIIDRIFDNSKGSGYVEFDSSVSAASALTAKKGSLIDGCEVHVDFSAPRNTDAPRDFADNRTKTFGDSQESVDVRDLVKGHMNDPRSIILAVVSAERDPTVQVS